MFSNHSEALCAAKSDFICPEFETYARNLAVFGTNQLEMVRAGVCVNVILVRAGVCVNVTSYRFSSLFDELFWAILRMFCECFATVLRLIWSMNRGSAKRSVGAIFDLRCTFFRLFFTVFHWYLMVLHCSSAVLWLFWHCFAADLGIFWRAGQRTCRYDCFLRGLPLEFKMMHFTFINKWRTLH